MTLDDAGVIDLAIGDKLCLLVCESLSLVEQLFGIKKRQLYDMSLGK